MHTRAARTQYTTLDYTTAGEEEGQEEGKEGQGEENKRRGRGREEEEEEEEEGAYNRHAGPVNT